jgi:hypothetical protein
MGGEDLRMWGVLLEERSTETTEGEGECELGMGGMGGGEGSKCLRLYEVESGVGG